MLAECSSCFFPCSYQMLEEKELKERGLSFGLPSASGDTAHHNEEGMAAGV